MDIATTTIPGVLTLRPKVHVDQRGSFTRTWDAEVARAAGLPDFVQDSQSRSVGGVIRALHVRGGGGEAKLVRCARGRIFDVVVDLRRDSPTYCRWDTFLLDDVEHVSLFIPRLCAHGIQALTDPADICYRIDRPYDPVEGLTIAFDDPDLAIPWPQPPTALSQSDRRGRPLADVLAALGHAGPA